MKIDMKFNDCKPLLAIRCVTYNHEPYIRDCLEGFIMQKTNFKFVAIVHDDASTDNTALIIKEYAEKYPDIIKPILQTENQHSKGPGTIGKILNEAIDNTEVKYVALCEGDDYWIDPCKLQKQVDFLENNQDYSMCFHSAIIKNETCNSSIIACDNIKEKEYFTNDIFPHWIIPTASVVYNKRIVDKYPPLKWINWMKFGDIVLFLKCTHMGRVWGMNDKMSVYRMTNNGAVNSQHKEMNLAEKLCKHYKFLMINFPMLPKDSCCYCISQCYYTMFRESHSFPKKLYELFMSFYYSPQFVYKKILLFLR